MPVKSFQNFLDKKTLSADQLAKKHKVPVEKIKAALKQGKKIEHEHTTKDDVASKIAAAHVGEDPKYYQKLRKIEEKNWEKWWLKKAIKKATKNHYEHGKAKKKSRDK